MSLFNALISGLRDVARDAAGQPTGFNGGYGSFNNGYGQNVGPTGHPTAARPAPMQPCYCAPTARPTPAGRKGR